MESQNQGPSQASTPAPRDPRDPRDPREPRDPRDGRDPREPREQRERIQSFEQMKVWQEAHALVLRIFEVTAHIPSDHQEGFAALMEKTAIEVPKAVAEGFKRRGSRNKAHYYNLAQSSLEALRYMLILGRDLKFLPDFDDLWTRADQVSRMLDGLVRSMTRSNRGPGRGDNRNDNRRRGGGGGRQRDDEPHDAPASNHDDDWDDEE